MESVMPVVDEYLKASQPKWLPSGRSEDQLKLARKSSAQRVARAATEAIADRKARAAAKIAVYNHLIPILEQHHRTERQLHRTYRRLLAWLCGALFIAAGAAVLIWQG